MVDYESEEFLLIAIDTCAYHSIIFDMLISQHLYYDCGSGWQIVEFF
jgi:hypothetical protein